jgi:two-component system phosphate regulon sensor histidine kinase PhoR
VRDHGGGIPEKKLPYIFDEINEREKQYNEGMGTGLFVARQVLAKHQGLIEVSSKPDLGTTIKLTIPRTRLEH